LLALNGSRRGDRLAKSGEFGLAVAAPGTKVDRRTAVEAQALATVRQLLTELGGARGLEELTARGLAAHLERDLGLGSLERVELMLRLGNTTGVRLPDRVMAEANSIEDLVDSILREDKSPSDPKAASENRTLIAEPKRAAPTENAELERRVRAAESLTEVLRLRCLGEPERVHILLYDESGEPRAITFGELYHRGSAVAAELARRGLEPGQTVALMLPTCAEFFATFAGILLAGGIPVPIYPPFRADRIAEYASRQSNILRNAEARFLVTFRQGQGLARLLRPNVPSLREVLNAQRLSALPHAPVTTDSTDAEKNWRPVENLAHHARGEDIAFLQYTSGSTGNPKGVILTHANLLANIRAIVEGFGVNREDLAVSWLPLYHDMGLIGAWFTPLFAGIPLVVMSPIAFLGEPVRWLRAIHRHHGTLSPAPNFAYELCLRKIADQDLDGLDLSSWRAALNGAEPVQPATIERFVARFAPYGFRREAMLPVYGLAENCVGVSAPKLGTVYRIDRINRGALESRGQAVPAATGDSAALEFVSAGHPLPTVECRIVTSDGADAGERTEGRLWFRGPSATSGYYRNPDATGELIRADRWHESGDLAYSVDGELFITGRAKDLIIKAGRNLYPQEVEQVAGRIAGVRPGCVVAFGAPDERSGTERFVVTAEIRKAADSNRISAEISRAVQEAMGLPPDIVELLPPQSIPKTSSGKLRRTETRRLYLAGKLGESRRPAWMQIASLSLRGSIPRAWSLSKRAARNAIEVLYGMYALALCALMVTALWAMVLVTRDAPRAARLIRSAARMLLRGAFIPVRIENGSLLDQLPKAGPWILTPNHSSYVDIIVALAVLPSTVRFLVKGDATKMPLFGTIARRSGQHFFDRNDPAARVRQAEEVERALGRGESVVVYPEGTFTPVTGIRPFQLGAFKAAVEAGRPICPVAIRGARQILRDKTYLPKFGRISVTLGPLLEPHESARDDWQEIVRLRDRTREIIARNSAEPML
jgi:fatty-acyl-CoA synthase